MAEARADIIALSDYVYQGGGGGGGEAELGRGRGDPAPVSAVAAVAALEQAGSFWHKLLEALPAEAWSEKLGPAAGPFADDDKTSLVLHQLDEQIHHGAELGVLRDLYRWQP